LKSAIDFFGKKTVESHSEADEDKPTL